MNTCLKRPLRFDPRLLNRLSCMLLVCFLSETARGQSLFTLVDGNSLLEINTGAQATAYQWKVDGKQHLEELSNWYRVGNNPSTPETSVHTLAIISETQTGPNTLNVQYLSAGQFLLEIDFALFGGAPGSGFSTMGETIQITNLTSLPMSFHLFEYVDLDLDETPLDDTVWLTSPNSLMQADPFTDFQGTFDVDRYELDYQPNTLGKLTDPVASALSDSWPTGAGPLGPPGDVTWALQWDFVGSIGARPQISPGQTAIVSKECQLQMYFVPEPGTCALSLWIAVLIAHFIPRRVKSYTLGRSWAVHRN